MAGHKLLLSFFLSFFFFLAVNDMIKALYIGMYKIYRESTRWTAGNLEHEDDLYCGGVYVNKAHNNFFLLFTR